MSMRLTLIMYTVIATIMILFLNRVSLKQRQSQLMERISKRKIMPLKPAF